jgi:O-antigen/teichoic acid export membrane protein
LEIEVPVLSLSRSIARNVVFKGAGEILVRLLAFAFVVFVARSLQAADFGALNFAYSFPLLFIVFADFGFNPLLVRELSRSPENGARVFSNLLALKLLLSAAYLLAVFIGLRILAPAPAFASTTYLLAGFMLLNSFTEFINAVFQARQQMHLDSGVMTWQKLSLLGFGLLALALGWGLYGVAGAYLASGACGLAAAIWILTRRRFLPGSWRLDRAFLRYAFRQALPLTLTTLFINLYFRIDMTLLAKLRPAAEVGWYGAAHKCIEVLMLVPAVLVVSSFPGFSRLYLEDRERLGRAAHRLLRLLLLLALPLAAGAALLGRPLMMLVFGPAFAPSGPALGWLAAALGFIFLNYPLSYLLITGERQTVNAVVSGAAVLVSVGANLLLIPAYGYLGSAAAAALTEGVLLAAYAAAVHRFLFPLPWAGPLLRTAAATAVMTAVVWLLRSSPLWIPVAAGGVVYTAAAWLLRAVDRDDLGLLARLWTRGSHA